MFFGVGTQIISFFCRIFRSKTATPKSARLKFEQPRKVGFRYIPQKPCKALCGRRCRPLCPARGKQGNPSLSPAYFRTACRFPQKGAKTATNGSWHSQGVCLPAIGLYLATRGGTGADTAVTSASPEPRFRHRLPHKSYRRDPPYRRPMHSARLWTHRGFQRCA